jgi:hypothetical protein
MNEHVITFADISFFVVFLSAAAGLWYRVETHVSKSATAALAKIEIVEKALNEYKLEVAENYAKQTFIRDVEQRLAGRFDDVVAELHGMRQDFQKAVVDMAKSGSTRRRS